MHTVCSNIETLLHIKESYTHTCHVKEFLHMKNVETNLFCQILGFFAAKSVLLPFTREIYSVAIHALLRGEKLNQKLGLWRKRQISGILTPQQCHCTAVHFRTTLNSTVHIKYSILHTFCGMALESHTPQQCIA